MRGIFFENKFKKTCGLNKKVLPLFCGRAIAFLNGPEKIPISEE